MLTPISILLFSTTPVILGGTANLIFIKSPLFDFLKRPLDSGRLWKDGKPILGSNKTWKGLLGSVVLTAAAMAILYLILGDAMAELTVFPLHAERPLLFLIMEGALLGLAYILFELPNSFFKRRFDISPGRTTKGLRGGVFRTVDQIDSVVGCGLVLLLFGHISVIDLLVLVLLGAVIHVLVTQAQYGLGLR